MYLYGFSSVFQGGKLFPFPSVSVICGLEEWRHILEGTKHMIEILNDHRNLTYFRMAQTLNHCQAQ